MSMRRTATGATTAADKLQTTALGDVAAALDGQNLEIEDLAAGPPWSGAGPLVIGYRCRPARWSVPPQQAWATGIRFLPGSSPGSLAEPSPVSSPPPLEEAVGTLRLAIDGSGHIECRWAEQPLRDCHLVFAADRAAIVASITQVPQDITFPARFDIDDTGSGGRWHGPIPPLDMAVVPAFTSLPVIAGASVTAQLVLTGSPVGVIAYRLILADGQLTAIELGASGDADVFIRFRYADYLQVRAGTMVMAEALRSGDLDGSFGKAQMLSGLIQSPPFEDAYRHGFGALQNLAAFSFLVDLPAFRLLATSVRNALGLDS